MAKLNSVAKRLQNLESAIGPEVVMLTFANSSTRSLSMTRKKSGDLLSRALRFAGYFVRIADHREGRTILVGGEGDEEAKIIPTPMPEPWEHTPQDDILTMLDTAVRIESDDSSVILALDCWRTAKTMEKELEKEQEPAKSLS